MLRFLSLALASVLLLIACGDDDEAVVVTQEGLVGTWRLTENTSETTTSSDLGGQSASVTATGRTEESTAEMTFEADGTYTTTGQVTLVITTVGVEQRQTLNYDSQGGTYELAGNTIRFAGPGISVDGNTVASSSEARVTTFVPGQRLEMETDIDERQEIPGVGAINVTGVSRVTLEQ